MFWCILFVSWQLFVWCSLFRIIIMLQFSFRWFRLQEVSFCFTYEIPYLHSNNKVAPLWLKGHRFELWKQPLHKIKVRLRIKLNIPRPCQRGKTCALGDAILTISRKGYKQNKAKKVEVKAEEFIKELTGVHQIPTQEWIKE